MKQPSSVGTSLMYDRSKIDPHQWATGVFFWNIFSDDNLSIDKNVSNTLLNKQ